MLFKKNHLSRMDRTGRTDRVFINRRFMNMPPQLYYQNGFENLNGYDLNNGRYMYGGDFINHNHIQYQQIPQGLHGEEISYNPNLHPQVEAGYAALGNLQNGNNSWHPNPNRVDEYHSEFNQMNQPAYHEYENSQTNSNIIGNPLIHEEVSFKQHGNMGNFNQFSNEPFLGYKPDKTVKKPGAFKSVIDQFKSDNGSIDFNKMVGTTSQLATAINQVSGFVKGVSGIFKVGA